MDTSPPHTPAAFISGITGGIGSALARRLHASGWRVAGLARTETALAALADELPGLWTRAGDALAEGVMETAIRDAAAATGGRLDAVAHAIGSIVLKPAHQTTPAEFDAVVALNLRTAFLALRAATGLMQRQPGGGSILLFSTTAAQVGLPNHEAIAAAKGGIEAMARSAAATYAPRQVRVNALAPGLTETPGAAGLLASDLARQASVAMHPLGRLGRADDVAALAAWLLSPEAAWVTGQCWAIDGGVSTLRQRPKL